jgi:RND family efflux transporter MFP subunit
MKRFLFPTLGVLVLGVTVVQVRAMRGSTHPAAAAQQHTASVTAEGRVVAYPGAEVTVSTDVAGTIERLRVAEKDSVHKGDVLAELKADDTRAALAEARARVAEAEADIRLYASENARAKKLFDDAVGSREAWDRAGRDLDAARARRESAIAEVKRLEATLAKSVIVAPIDGVVTDRPVHPGEHVASGDAIVTVANLAKTRVEAEVDEFDSARVAVGDAVTITADGYDGRTWRGKVEEIPDTVVSRRIKPQDPSKPIDTRVLLVKVALSEATPLKLGQRVEVGIR